MKKSLTVGIISLFILSALAPMSLGKNVKTDVEIESETTINDGPMDSAWPMYCYDSRHTGRSPYNTVDNPGFEKWWYKTGNYVEGSAAIDNNSVIYFGSWKHGKDNFFSFES